MKYKKCDGISRVKMHSALSLAVKVGDRSQCDGTAGDLSAFSRVGSIFLISGLGGLAK
jgi:hypothetical protein